MDHQHILHSAMSILDLSEHDINCLPMCVTRDIFNIDSMLEIFNGNCSNPFVKKATHVAQRALQHRPPSPPKNYSNPASEPNLKTQDGQQVWRIKYKLHYNIHSRLWRVGYENHTFEPFDSFTSTWI